MKILFFSDVHGITTNLDKIEESIEKLNPDYVVALGDLYGSDLKNNEYIYNFLMKYRDKLILTLGNCDTYNDLFIDNMRLEIDDIAMFISHGHEYNYDRLSKIDGCNILIYGHKHIPYIRKKDGITYICVGSISLPRNETGATYMIYNNKKFTIYDMNGNIIDEFSVMS